MDDATIQTALRHPEEGIITYSVATLGTATTPEHLIRIFRVCSEVVFCFDGDRAGRAAAWRALENALSQVREGRQIRFLFLPDGHDPDSLVGEEGREKFEKRLDSALPLSDYFIKELSSRSDIASVDGRAQFAAAAKPLVAKIPDEVYRELLIDALAKVVGMSPERLMGLIGGSGVQNSTTASPEARNTEFASSQPSNPAGRSNLVRQAVHLLVHFPAAAKSVPAGLNLSAVNLRGIPLLTGLIDSLRANPVPTTGALLERWRDQPDYPSLVRLSTLECVVPDAAGASRELVDALQRLINEDAPKRRMDDLVNKAKHMPLTPEETLELKELWNAKARAFSAASAAEKEP